MESPTARYAPYYNMNHPKRGLAIIFNHELFTVSHLKARAGTNVDCDNLINTLKNLHFEVRDYHNLTHRDLIRNLETSKSLLIQNTLYTICKLILHDFRSIVSDMDHAQHDCLVIAVLSHGELGLLYAYDTPYKAESIWGYFTAERCPTLAGKPKMFFIQACQGDKLDGGVTLKDRTETDGQPTVTYRVPTHADFLIAYSTIPGEISFYT